MIFFMRLLTFSRYIPIIVYGLNSILIFASAVCNSRGSISTRSVGSGSDGSPSGSISRVSSRNKILFLLLGICTKLL